MGQKMATMQRVSSTSGSGTTGPQPGLGSGQRPPGVPEPTTFQRDKISASGLDPRGTVVGSFLTDGPSATGEPSIRAGGALESRVRELSEEVQKEPLPVENRDQIQRFHELLLGGQADPGGK